MSLESDYCDRLLQVFSSAIVAWLFKGDEPAKIAAFGSYATATGDLRTQMLRQLAEICLIPSVGVADRQKGVEFSADLSRKDWSVIEAWKVRRVLKRANRDYEWAIMRGKPEIFSHRYPDIPAIVSQRAIREYAISRAFFDFAMASKAKDAATARLQELAASTAAAKPAQGTLATPQVSLPIATVEQCITCRTDLVPGHKFCRACGGEVERGSGTVAASLSPKECPTCKLINAGTAERCDCGEAI